MKCISIRQPWALAIVKGFKDVENRSWKTDYRGPILIHASKKIDNEGYSWIQKRFPDIAQELKPHELITGAIIGQAELVECTESHSSPWFEGKWGFVLRNAVVFKEPCYINGKLNLFDVDYGKVCNLASSLPQNDSDVNQLPLF
jgi:hypothetical protein